MFRKVLMSLTFCLFAVSSAFSQTGTLSGEVTDSRTGELLVGVNIFVEQLGRGAVTNLDGEYTITNLPVGEYTVRVTYVGYGAREEEVVISEGVNVLNFDLAPELVGLDEMLVTGYAVTPKREVTGSIASVRAADIQDVTLQNPESLLQGRAAGVNVTTTSGNPGGAFRVNVRGQGSVHSATEPLYIVDGVQMSFSQLSTQTSTSPMNALDPADIQSIEVLKDASSAAIYGAQAAAGVVIITTKRGHEGRTNITARAETGVRSLARNVNYVNTDQYIQYMGEAFALNSGVPLSEDISPFIDAERNWFLAVFGPDPDSDPADPQLANFDWQDFIYDEGVTRKYNIQASGGDATTRFFLSAGYEDTEGTVYDSDFTRLNLRTNLDHQVSERFRTSLTTNLSRSTQFGVCQDGNFTNCPTAAAMFFAPFSFPYLADGSYNPRMGFLGATNNPALQRDHVERNVTVTQIIGNVNLVYDVTDWLSFSGQVGVDYRNTEDDQYRSPIAQPGEGGFAFFANRNVNNFNTNFVANARYTFNDVHNVTGVAGTEYRRDYWDTRLVEGQGFPGTFFKVLQASARPTMAAGLSSEWRLGSYFGNLRYNYNERYYLSFVARYDGHSRFGADTRWGFFPSFSGAWRVSEEDFFNVALIDELKLRAGYGTTGNSQIGNFAARGLFGAQGSYMGATALRPTQLANVNLGWEEASEINIGLDYELFLGRVYGAVDVYRKDNSQLLFARPLPTDSGFSSISENIGKVRNEGVELELNTINVATGTFMWSTRFNVAFVDNEILELPDRTDIDADDAFEALKEGKPIGLIQVPRWAGVNPADGRPMWYDGDGNITYNPVQERDAVEYKDGVANTVGGFGNTFTYRGLTLDAFFQFSFGQWSSSGTDYWFTTTPDFLTNLHEKVEDRWQHPGDMTYYPRAVYTGNDYPETVDYRGQHGTHNVYNASYIRLKNVSLSYNLPHRWVRQAGIANMRIFASAINLLTWTAWPWYDPEIAWDTRDIYNNFTQASYPTERQVNAGIEVRF